MENPRKPVLTVVFYATGNGKEPVREWLKALPLPSRKTIGEDLNTAQFGWPLGMPLIRKVGKNLWEVRSNLWEGIARILFTVNGSEMILLHGFIKKSQAIPMHELETAELRMKKHHGV